MADTTDISPAPTAASADVVPERPGWMQSDRSPSTRQRHGTPPPSAKRAKPQPLIVPGADDDEPLPWHRQFVFWLTSAAATGYGLSLLIHAGILTAMGVYILPGLMQSSDITTVVQSEAEVPEEFDDLQDVQLDSPAGSEEVIKPQLTEMIETDTELTKLEHDFLRDVTAAEAEGENGTTTGTGGGFKLLEPKNAVRKGSFTAWTIPIARRFGEEPQAGDSPRPGQPYYIVIQVKLKEGQRVYKVNDLSGKIVGTDGYQQLIPGGAYVQDRKGNLIRAKIGRMLPIVDGVSQIVIKVPGADALVKDTIVVNSRLLKERQTLELVFGQ